MAFQRASVESKHAQAGVMVAHRNGTTVNKQARKFDADQVNAYKR